uniref:GGDEF domain-containing phosphodiesterase n=1 Tax=Eubacterium cellulosolvens TaxID=29322 RepID=UPI000488861C|nr:GGDEF domain-containing phosphodiesterase [[Eubacterium] cellulosolvens]
MSDPFENENSREYNLPLSRLERELFYDSLTGLLSQYAFNLKMEDKVTGIYTESKSPVFIFADIVGMKHINNEYGFFMGNEVIASVGKALSSVFSESLCSRYDNDHFLVLTEDGEIIERLNRIYTILQEFTMPVPVVDLKFGVYYQEKPGEEPALNCDKARIAERTIHSDHRSRIAVYTEDMYVKYMRRNHVLSHIQDAIENREIQIYYQPIIRAVSVKVSAVEALARWNSPQEGMISPDEFISYLEEEHMSALLDMHVVETVLREFEDRERLGLPIVPVSVNLSQSTLETIDVVSEVRRLTEKYDIQPDYLMIEITESACVRNPEKLREVIDGFHQAGFHVWMDDFGSGYSSLNVLQKFNFDLIKFDMKFLEDFTYEGKGEKIFRHMIRMAHDLHIHTLAEGVKTEEEYVFLKSIGCERMQGYLFNRPMPLDGYSEDFRRDIRVVTETLADAEYYEKIGEVDIEKEDLPEELNGKLHRIPEALVEARDGKLIFIRANKVYLEYMTCAGMIGGHTDQSMLRHEWCVPASEAISRSMELSWQKDSWEYFEEHNPQSGSTHTGWVRIIAEEEERNARCFHIIMEK